MVRGASKAPHSGRARAQAGRDGFGVLPVVARGSGAAAASPRGTSSAALSSEITKSSSGGIAPPPEEAGTPSPGPDDPATMAQAATYQQLRGHLAQLKLTTAAEQLPIVLDPARTRALHTPDAAHLAALEQAVADL